MAGPTPVLIPDSAVQPAIKRWLMLALWVFCPLAAADSPLVIEWSGVEESEVRALDEQLQKENSRLERLFDPRAQDGELAQLNQTGRADSLSPELYRLLALCEEWRQTTGNAFSCRLGSLHDDWEKAQETDELPDRAALRRKALDLQEADWTLSESGISLDTMQVAPDVLGRGHRLDRLMAMARELAPQAEGVAIELAGQGVYWGLGPEGEPWSRSVMGDKENPAQLTLPSLAVASVDHSSGIRVDRRHFSEVMDPDEGWLLSFAPSVQVVAPRAADAEVLAATLSVLPIREGIQLVEQLTETEARIMTEEGNTFATEGWYSLLVPDSQHQPLWSGDNLFVVEYEIPAHRVAEYRRPYAAVWITDEDRQLVRQLLLHGENLRWLGEVPLWWRRYGRRDEMAIDGLTQPTPVVGRHMVVWDGRDDRGRAVPEGQYTLHVEASREHGDRELISVDFELSGEAFEHQAQGDKELGKVRLSYSLE